jgi:glucose 1-dehydrogenase
LRDTTEEEEMRTKLLEKTRAIVTGASSGIGEAIAVAFANAGASVVVNYRSSMEAADRVTSEIRARGGHAITVQADISKPESCSRLFEAAHQEFGGIDIVVANAGIQRARCGIYRHDPGGLAKYS